MNSDALLFNPKGKIAMKTSILISAIMDMDKHMSRMREKMKAMRGMGGPWR